MASTAGRLDIYNMALGYIGTRTISSPNEQTPEAVQCNLYWDRARRAALRDFPYNFATRRTRLAARDLPEEYALQWQAAYGMPADCLKLRRVHDGRNAHSPFRIVQHNGALTILSGVPQAYADYTADVEDVSLWDDLFTDAMARKLACMISTALLKNNPQKQQQLEQLYAMAVPRADGQDASEADLKKERPDAWLEARGGWDSGTPETIVAVQNESASEAAARAAEKTAAQQAARIAELRSQIGELVARLHELEATDYSAIFETGEET